MHKEKPLLTYSQIKELGRHFLWTTTLQNWKTKNFTITQLHTVGGEQEANENK